MPAKLTPNIKLEFFGGADRDRTGGLLVANQALSQLSYSPMTQLPAASSQLPVLLAADNWQLAAALVGLGRLELPTSPLSGVRSSHLSYRPGRSRSSGAVTKLLQHLALGS